MSRGFDEPNPYASPSAAIKGSTKDPEPSELRLLLRWEKLRILYNTILAAVTVVTLLIAFPRSMTLSGLFFALAVLCFGANVCFCLGPVLDGYARRMGMRDKAVTILIFVFGTGFAVLLALAALFSLNMRGFD